MKHLHTIFDIVSSGIFNPLPEDLAFTIYYKYIGVNKAHSRVFIQEAHFALKILRQHHIIVMQNANILTIGQTKATIRIADKPKIFWITDISNARISETANNISGIIGRAIITDDKSKILVCLA
jgi:hypothetical protein